MSQVATLNGHQSHPQQQPTNGVSQQQPAYASYGSFNSVDMSPAAVLRLSKKHLLCPGEQQPFEYLVVLDFEATCEADRSTQDPQEIIEFPAVIVHTASEQVIAEFHRFVKPTVKPVLSTFCRQLTGISQETVEEAEEFPAVLKAFLEWMIAEGLDPQGLTGPSYMLLTHGDWDLRDMLPKQMDMCDLTGKEGYDAPCVRRWINLNPVFDAAFFVTPGVLPKLSSGVESIAVHLNMRLEGRLHSGIDDTRHIARIVIRMLRFGVRFTPIQSTCHRCGLPGHFARECPNAPPGYGMHQGRGIMGMPYAPPPVQRPGDWFCSICGNLVFARRLQCFQCGTPRP
jgi:ERI1 exoribonuclease 3